MSPRSQCAACLAAIALATAGSAGATEVRPPGELWSQFPLKNTTTVQAPPESGVIRPQRALEPAPSSPQPSSPRAVDTVNAKIAFLFFASALAVAGSSVRGRTALASIRRLAVAAAQTSLRLARTIPRHARRLKR